MIHQKSPSKNIPKVSSTSLLTCPKTATLDLKKSLLRNPAWLLRNLCIWYKPLFTLNFGRACTDCARVVVSGTCAPLHWAWGEKCIKIGARMPELLAWKHSIVFQWQKSKLLLRLLLVQGELLQILPKEGVLPRWWKRLPTSLLCWQESQDHGAVDWYGLSLCRTWQDDVIITLVSLHDE